MILKRISILNYKKPGAGGIGILAEDELFYRTKTVWGKTNFAGCGLLSFFL